MVNKMSQPNGTLYQSSRHFLSTDKNVIFIMCCTLQVSTIFLVMSYVFSKLSTSFYFPLLENNKLVQILILQLYLTTHTHISILQRAVMIPLPTLPLSATNSITHLCPQPQDPTLPTEPLTKHAPLTTPNLSYPITALCDYKSYIFIIEETKWKGKYWSTDNTKNRKTKRNLLPKIGSW